MNKPSTIRSRLIPVLLGSLNRLFNTPLFFLLTASIGTYAGSAAAADIRINVGGNKYTDSVGNVWSADRGFNTGKVSTRKRSIAGTTDDPLYYNQRYDSGTAPEMVYSFAVPNGDYAVNLHFAETYSGAYGRGLRVFDVAIEGALVLDNVDIFSQTGGAQKLLVHNVPLVTVTDGQMNIKFIHHVENPKVAAIEILALGGATTDSSPPAEPKNVNAVAVGPEQVNLTWNVSTDVGGGLVAGYRIHRNGQLIGSATGTSYSDNTVKPGTAYKYTISAFDTAAPANESIKSAIASITTPASSGSVSTPASSQFAIRINVGGNKYTDSVGNVWSADRGFNTGKISTRKRSIAGTTDDPLYYNQRYDSGTAPEMVYSFAVPNGDYAVNLHFAETYSGAYGSGLRVFDVAIEGALVLDNVDIFSQAGGSQKLLVRNVPLVTVTDGQMNIKFIHHVENPKVAAIEIVALGLSSAAPTVGTNLNTKNNIFYINHNNIPAGHKVTDADITKWFLAKQSKAGIANDRLSPNGGAIDIVADPSGDPARGNVMRVFQSEGGYGFTDGLHGPSNGQWRSWPGSYEELYFSYDFYMEPNRLWSKGQKLPGLMGGDWATASGGTLPVGNDAFSARLQMYSTKAFPGKGDGALAQYTYYPGKAQQYEWYDDGIGGQINLELGKWYTIETYIKLNTPGKNNGKLQAWVDGELVLNKQNHIWRTASSLKIDGVFFAFGYGGSNSSWAAPEDQYNYFDNWVLSTQPISH
jgi:hypothetical protein